MTDLVEPSPVAIHPIPFEQTYALRHQVLWPDKPFDYVKVENDADGYHFGAFLSGNLVAVISLFIDESEGHLRQARFRKFAARPDAQRRGIGTQLLNHVIAKAQQLGATVLWCDARLDAADFYRRFGMEAVSDVFYKGPIPYAKFSRTL